MNKRARGFTLIELMIVVAIVAILAALAFNAYNKQVRKGRRADAKGSVAELIMKQEKYRANNPNYGTLANLSSAATSNGAYYSLAITFPTSGTCTGGANKGNANSYTITATALGDQARDATCTPMVLVNDCGKAPIKTPTDCW
jgi:type IV pilus assembly protein PilE